MHYVITFPGMGSRRRSTQVGQGDGETNNFDHTHKLQDNFETLTHAFSFRSSAYLKSHVEKGPRGFIIKCLIVMPYFSFPSPSLNGHTVPSPWEQGLVWELSKQKQRHNILK